MGFPEDTRSKWERWIKDQWADLNVLRLQREFVRETLDAIGDREEAHWSTNVMGRMYVDSQAMAVRRMVDAGGDSIGLRRLLEQVLDHPHLLSREWFVERWLDVNGGETEAAAHAEYDDLFGTGAPWPADRAVFNDIKELKSATEVVTGYAHRVIAHMDRRPSPELANVAELDAAVDRVVEMFRKWAIVICGSDLAVGPVIQGDWKRPFYEPLFPPPPWSESSE